MAGEAVIEAVMVQTGRVAWMARDDVGNDVQLMDVGLLVAGAWMCPAPKK